MDHSGKDVEDTGGGAVRSRSPLDNQRAYRTGVCTVFKVLEIGNMFVVTEDLKAWPLHHYKKTFRLVTQPSGIFLQAL